MVTASSIAVGFLVARLSSRHTRQVCSWLWLIVVDFSILDIYRDKDEKLGIALAR